MVQSLGTVSLLSIKKFFLIVHSIFIHFILSYAFSDEIKRVFSRHKVSNYALVVNFIIFHFYQVHVCKNCNLKNCFIHFADIILVVLMAFFVTLVAFLLLITLLRAEEKCLEFLIYMMVVLLSALLFCGLILSEFLSFLLVLSSTIG